MNRHLRKHVRNLAYWLEDVVAPWLHQKAERPARVQPLAFPTPFEETMDRIMRPMIQNMANQIARDLASDISITKMFYGDNGPVVVRLTPEEFYK